MIYFIQAGDCGPIKIGTCKDDAFNRRIVSLQTGAPDSFEILGVMDGGASEEKRLHALFRADRHRGEWFLSSPQMLAFIAANCRHADAPEPRERKPVLDKGSFRARLAESVAASGRSLRDLSLSAGLGPNFAHQILKHGKDPSIENLMALCAELGTKVSHLIGEDVAA